MRHIPLCLLSLALASCVTTGSPPPSSPTAYQIPGYITAEKGCAVVVGGSIGSRFSDPKINGFWHLVNSEISGQLYDRLLRDKYKVAKLIVAQEDADNTEQVVVRSVVQNQCNRIIQIAHTVNEDGDGKFFRYEILALRFEATGRTPDATKTVTVGEFKQEYRYPRTQAGFDAFHIDAFVARVYTDLDRSGVLDALR